VEGRPEQSGDLKDFRASGFRSAPSSRGSLALRVESCGFLPRIRARPFPAGVGTGEADSDRRKETREPVTEYEILLLLDPDLEEERQGEVVTRARDLVEKAGGSWDVHDVWGRRKLAFEIDHKGEGVYHLLQFTCEAGTLDEISRVLRIDDGVLRHMATRRIEGSPARPVAASAPTREDAEVPSPTEEHVEAPADVPIEEQPEGQQIEEEEE
jgi:small subunit ribosomal protein S6